MHVLTQQDLAFWHENGYVIVPDAVPQSKCTEAVVDIIWEFMEMDRHDPETWYRSSDGDDGLPRLKESGMAELYQHQALWDNRQHPRVYGAFVDIWETEKLWVSIDRVNLNPAGAARLGFPVVLYIGTLIHRSGRSPCGCKASWPWLDVPAEDAGGLAGRPRFSSAL